MIRPSAIRRGVPAILAALAFTGLLAGVVAADGFVATPAAPARVLSRPSPAEAEVASEPEPATPAPVPTPAVQSNPSGPRDRLVSSDGTLSVATGIYNDCSGQSEIPRALAALDPCFLGRRYFVGHNPGVFSPLLHMRPGDRITYYDSEGRAEVFRIVAVRLASRWSFTLPVSPDVAAQFQTCAVSDGSVDRLLDAVRD